MGYAFMATALGSLVVLAFVYRRAGSQHANRLTMATMLGATTALCALGYAAARGIDVRQAEASQFLVGAGLGLVQMVLIPVFMAAVARGDLSITWTVLTLAFALASGMVLVYPGEQPTALGVGGLVLAGAAVALIGLDTIARHRGALAGRPRRGWALLVAVSFVLNAACAYSYSLAAHLQGAASPANKPALLLTSGTVLGVGTLLLSGVMRSSGSRRWGLGLGVAAGAATFATGMSLLHALGAGVPGHVLYPAAIGGSSFVVVVVSVVFLGERPGRWGWAGILGGLSALVLIGLAA